LFAAYNTTNNASSFNAVASSQDRGVGILGRDSAALGRSDGYGFANARSHTSSINAVTFLQDGKTVTSASMRLWDELIGTALQTLEGHTSAVNAVTLLRGGETVVSASDDETVRALGHGDRRHSADLKNCFIEQLIFSEGSHLETNRGLLQYIPNLTQPAQVPFLSHLAKLSSPWSIHNSA
jgi:WD40 repeat protein